MHRGTKETHAKVRKNAPCLAEKENALLDGERTQMFVSVEIINVHGVGF